MSTCVVLTILDVEMQAVWEWSIHQHTQANSDWPAIFLDRENGHAL